MNSKKITYVTVIILLIGSNCYWIINDYRSKNREKYNMTFNCEQDELIFSLQTFQKGLSYQEFKSKISGMELTFYQEWENGNHHYIQVGDILNKCPESSRPYCRIQFSFENESLIEIDRAYPCH